MKDLIIHFLTEYASELADNSCNDIDPNIFSHWPDEELPEFIREFNEWAAINENEGVCNIKQISDYELVKFLAYKLSKGEI